MSKVIMVTGGSRSGKSVIAEQKAKEYGKRSVLYLATAIPIDDDMKERIRMHQERRDPEWGTYEGYRDLGEIVKNTEKNILKKLIFRIINFCNWISFTVYHFLIFSTTFTI